MFKSLYARQAIGFLLALSLIWSIGAFPVSQKAGAESAKTTGIIHLDAGKISGLIVGNDPEVRVFKGIPFAASPVGNLRWKPPQPVKSWEGVRQCQTFGPVCPQPDTLFRFYGTKFDNISEDCLYLNIWTSAKDSKANLPVMFWIHGGGNISGAGSTPIYDGEALARQDVVLVSINYRSGPFRFFRPSPAVQRIQAGCFR